MQKGAQLIYTEIFTLLLLLRYDAHSAADGMPPRRISSLARIYQPIRASRKRRHCDAPAAKPPARWRWAHGFI